jgi:two-component system, chemotaxis family, protein-glutamate methylesterase/glutaminase
MIRVLIVDDSKTARMALREALEREVDLYVVAEAPTGRETLRLVDRHRPDLVTMDVYLKRESGLDVTSRIMELWATPILIVTGVRSDDPELAYQAMAAGALEVVGKLPSPDKPSYEPERRHLVDLVRVLSRVPVVHRRRMAAPVAEAAPAARGPTSSTPPDAEVILIGASTGGPPVILSLLSALRVPSALPIVVVQHIAPGFADGLAEWLSQSSGHQVVVVKQPLPVQAGRVHLANDGAHLVFASRSTVAPSDSPPELYQRPSVNLMFESAAAGFGRGAVAVLLGGMGSDGVRGLAELHRAGAMTLAQDPATCSVGSMPAAAIEAGVVDQVLAPADIAAVLQRANSAAELATRER